jgi:threonine/homoserine/homoserine lactone efflux protein
MTLEFLLTSLVVVIAPGTGVLYTVTFGISRGLRGAFAATIGCTLGIIPHLAASILGLAAILHTSAVLFQGIKFAGVAYLLYLAWMMLRDTGRLSFTDNRKAPDSFLKIAAGGLLANILNPKLSLFFLAFLPQFIPAHSSSASLDMMGLGAVFMGMTALVFLIYGAFAARLRRHVLDSPTVLTWLRRSIAGSFAALGLRLALTDAAK